MPVDRRQVRPSSRRFFKKLDRWNPGAAGFPNTHRDWMLPGEARRKVRRYAAVLAEVEARMRPRLEAGGDPLNLLTRAVARMTDASLFHLLTGERSAFRKAQEALDVLEACPQPHFCYVTLIGSVDIDLRTASVTCALAAMRNCFAEELDAGTARRVERAATERCLAPALSALRARRYFWCTCRHNWRSVMAGSFARGAMAFADAFPDWRELVEYGLEGVLVVLDAGDRTGGWQEGPGYWEYGIGHCAEFAAALGTFTGFAVDLFRHPFLARTGEFRIHMSPAPGRVWNWSDCAKAAGSSLTLSILARRLGNPAYQRAAFEGGLPSIRALAYLDPGLRPAAPSAAPGFPLTRLFPDIDVLAMRSGWGPKDAFVGVKGGTLGPRVNHEHADHGSLVVFCGGRELLAEPDQWPYAQSTGKAGGFFEKDGRRWDYDGNAPVAHNLVMVEGRFPPFGGEARARLRHASLGGDAELVEVDATAMHRALARRVGRLVVYLRPDILVLIDEVRAAEPVRARCLFHYLEEAETGKDSFVIQSGPAWLSGRSLLPSVADNVILGKDERTVSYHTELGLKERRNLCVYTENLHRTTRPLFVTGLRFGTGRMPAIRWTIDGDPSAGVFAVVAETGSRRVRLRVDLSQRDLRRKVRVRY